MSEKKISVVLRCKNESRWIGHALQSIIDHIPNNEVILIDNNSTDRSLEIVQQFQHNPSLKENRNKYTNVTIVNIDKYSPGIALNLGVKHASGEYVMFLSSHCEIKSFSASKVFKDLEKHVGIFGNQDPIYRGQRITKRYLWSHFGSEEKVNLYSDLEERYFFHNALSIMKRETLFNRPFDEELWGKEDRYWATDVIEKDKRSILYDPSFSCNHFYTSDGNTWKGVG